MKVLLNHYKRFSTTEKILFISLVLSFISTFFPWFYKIDVSAIPTSQGHDEVLKFHAYNGIGVVIGIFYSMIVFSSLVLLIASLKERIIQKFLERNSWIFFALVGQAIFMLVLVTITYLVYSMQFSRAGVDYGLIFSIIFTFIAFLSSHFYFSQGQKKSKQKNIRENLESNVYLDPQTVPDNEEKEPPVDDSKQMSLGDYPNT